MTIYTVISIILAALFIAEASVHFTPLSVKYARTLKGALIAEGVVGVFLVVLSVALFFTRLSSELDIDSQTRGWLADTMFSYVMICVVFAIVVALISVISGLLQPNFKILRILLLLFSSIIAVISGFIFSYIASNETFPMGIYVKLMALGTALAIQSPAFQEFGRKE